MTRTEIHSLLLVLGGFLACVGNLVLVNYLQSPEAAPRRPEPAPVTLVCATDSCDTVTITEATVSFYDACKKAPSREMKISYQADGFIYASGGGESAALTQTSPFVWIDTKPIPQKTYIKK